MNSEIIIQKGESKKSKNLSMMVKNDKIPYPEFLTHFYNVLQRYLASDEIHINKIFNLYLVQTRKNKDDAETFRERYVKSFTEYTRENNEVGYCYKFLQMNDKEAIDFLIKTKKKILTFYDISDKHLNVPLTDLTVKISEWINLLKSFPFFTKEKILKKIEKFKRHVLEENEQVLEINALEFLKSSYSFFISRIESESEIKLKKKTTSRETVNKNYDLDVIDYNNKNTDKNLVTLAKPSQKFGQANSNNIMNNKNNDLAGEVKRYKRNGKIVV
jgi:hypothetical protein